MALAPQWEEQQVCPGLQLVAWVRGETKEGFRRPWPRWLLQTGQGHGVQPGSLGQLCSWGLLGLMPSPSGEALPRVLLLRATPHPALEPRRRGQGMAWPAGSQMWLPQKSPGKIRKTPGSWAHCRPRAIGYHHLLCHAGVQRPAEPRDLV